MKKNALMGMALVSTLVFAGCASVPMAPQEQNLALKEFSTPTQGKAGLYIYRNSFFGNSLKKTIHVDGEEIGESANKVYFYKEITPGEHTLTTESEFGDNEVTFEAVGGRNYYAEQYIKSGIFVGGADFRMVNEKEGMKQVKQCNLAQQKQQ